MRTIQPMRGPAQAVGLIILMALATVVFFSCGDDEVSSPQPYEARPYEQQLRRDVDDAARVGARSATAGYRSDGKRVGDPSPIRDETGREECIQHMALEHMAALSTNDCRSILGWEWCPVMAVAIDWRLDNGQRIVELAALWERDCS